MANMLTDSRSWLNEQLAAHASDALTFWRGSASVAVNATVRKPGAPPITTAGPPIQPANAERDVCVRYADLASVLGTASPATGDYFTQSIGGRLFVFRVTSPMIGGPWWEWLNGDRGPEARIVVHTKQTAVFLGSGELTMAAETAGGVGALT